MKYQMMMWIGFLSTVIPFLTGFSLANENNVAVIYNGIYADAYSAEALSTLAGEYGLTTAWFNHPKMLLSLLKNARIVIVGGTVDDIDPLVESFTLDILQALKDFLNQGGAYLGVCGGGYIATSGWEEEYGFKKALELVPYASDSYMFNSRPQIIEITWNNKNRFVYYQYGPKFLLPENGSEKIIARYDDQSIAAFSMITGNGNIMLVGPHPEADETWIDYSVAHGDEWTSTQDMAREMMQEALHMSSPPQPDIKANGSDGPVVLPSGTSLIFNLSLDPGSYNLQSADWFLISHDPSGEFSSFDLGSNTFVPGIMPSLQAGLFGFSDIPIPLSTDLTTGVCTFFFGMDLNMNGQLDMDLSYYDFVDVTLQD